MGLFNNKNKQQNKAIANSLSADNSNMGNVLIQRAQLTDVTGTFDVTVKANTEAVVLMDGAVYGVLTAGKHTVQQNRKITANVDVCFVNKTVRMSAYWGTPSKIEFKDSETNIPVSLGASGSVAFEIVNVLKLFERALGTEVNVDVAWLTDHLASTIAMEVKDILARKLVTERLSFFDLSTHIKQASKDIKGELADVFNQFGVVVTIFTIDNLAYPDHVKQLLEKMATDRYILAQKDTSHAQLHEEAREDKDKQLALQHRVVDAVAKSISNDTTPPVHYCSSCGKEIPANSPFCPLCGTKQVHNVACSFCNATLNDEVIFCPKCGTRRS